MSSWVLLIHWSGTAMKRYTNKWLGAKVKYLFTMKGDEYGEDYEQYAYGNYLRTALILMWMIKWNIEDDVWFLSDLISFRGKIMCSFVAFVFSDFYEGSCVCVCSWKPNGVFPLAILSVPSYQFNHAEQCPRWTTSGEGPKRARPASKQATVTSRRPQPTRDDHPSLPWNKRVNSCLCRRLERKMFLKAS